jgi:glucose/mannose transport system permease protein
MRLTRDRILSLAFIGPSVLAIAVFVYALIGWTTYVSTSRWATLKPDYTFVGLANFQYIFSNFRFQDDVRNTVVFTFFFVLACLTVGLLLANLIDRKIRAEGAFRTIYLFPMAISYIVTGVAWKWILAPGQPGIAGNPAQPNGINQLLGLDPATNKWLTDASVAYIAPNSPLGTVLHDIGLGFLTNPTIGIPVAMLAVVLAAAWQMSGFVMILYLSGLRTIPEELREAARVDGASEWMIFRRITFPLLVPITLSAVIILGHISLKIYDLTVALTGGAGPGFATDTPANNMWQTAFRDGLFGRGAAIAVVMVVVVALVVVPYLVWTRRREVAE